MDTRLNICEGMLLSVLDQNKVAVRFLGVLNQNKTVVSFLGILDQNKTAVRFVSVLGQNQAAIATLSWHNRLKRDSCAYTLCVRSTLYSKYLPSHVCKLSTEKHCANITY